LRGGAEAIHGLALRLDCFAALAMTASSAGARTRNSRRQSRLSPLRPAEDTCAGNDTAAPAGHRSGRFSS
jgi:hypothetical protein